MASAPRPTALLLVAFALATGCRNPPPGPTVAADASDGGPDAGTPDAGGPPMARIYQSTVMSTLAGLGYVPAGVVLADIDRDGWRDLVSANGSDVSPQPLTVHRNLESATPPALPNHPTWYASDIDHHGDLAVGDIDGDGWLDVAVAVPFDPLRRPRTGSVKVYLNDGTGALRPQAAYAISGGMQVLDVALGDVDGDGDLDLAVAGVGSYEPGKPPTETPQRIHLNRDGRFETEPSWTTKDPMAGASIAFSDVNQDGRLDLVLGTRKLAVFYGTDAKDGPLPRVPDWTSAETHTALFGLDAGRLARSDDTLSILVADNCRNWSCPSRFVAYRPSTGASPTWSTTANNASKVLLLNANGDDWLDLAAAQLGAGEAGAPQLFLTGSASGFASSGNVTTDQPFLGTALAAADLRHRGLTKATVDTWPRAVVTLPQRQVESIDAVHVNGVPSTDWRWVPGDDWLTLGPALRKAGTMQVTVEYTWSPVADVASASLFAVGTSTVPFYSYFQPTPPVAAQ